MLQFLSFNLNDGWKSGIVATVRAMTCLRRNMVVEETNDAQAAAAR